MMAKHDGEVVGFMVYEQRADTIGLLKFAVDPEYRRQGVGTAMAERLMERLDPLYPGRQAITFEVRETNVPAQLFFQKMGFKVTRTLPRHYDDTEEDVYEMSYALERDVRQGPKWKGVNRIKDYLGSGSGPTDWLFDR